MNRNQLAEIIEARLIDNFDHASAHWQSTGPIHHFYVDNVLPIEIARQISSCFPSGNSMQVRKNLRELKYVAAQMDQYDPILEDVLFAFQDPRIVSLISKITDLNALEPDAELYAGGISMMSKGHFLNPHLDNSHDKERSRYRVLNLLYYVSEDWGIKDGGNLEIWPNGPKENQVTIESNFNRLAIMITNSKSWHSVSPVNSDRSRCCISNYYFSKLPAENAEYFHVTSFRGRPEQFIRDFVLRIDSKLRMGIRKIFPNGIIKTNHFYNKD